MKYTGEKEKLIKAVSVVGRLASTRSTLPILQNIYLEVKDGVLILRSTNLEQTVEARIEGEGLETGRLTVPARLLTDYLQNNSDQHITLASDDLTLTISSANHQATLKGLPAEEYPNLPDIKVEKSATIAAPVLSDLLSRTLFASAPDDSRPILNGLLFRFAEKGLELVGTDGYRLAYSALNSPYGVTGDFIVPRSSLMELQRLMGEDEVVIGFAGSQIRFQIGEIIFTSRVLEGKFPDYQAILPKNKTLTLRLSAAQLLQSLKLASLFSRDSAFSTKLHMEGEVLKITAVSPQLGESTNEIPLQKSVEKPFTVSCNAQYFIEALSGVSGDIDLEFNDEKSPIVLRRASVSDYLYLVMPLRSQ